MKCSMLQLLRQKQRIYNCCYSIKPVLQIIVFNIAHLDIHTQANKCNLLCAEQDIEHGIRVVIDCGNPRCLFKVGKRMKRV